MSFRIKAAAIAAIGLLLSACSPAALLNTLLVPSSGYSIKRDIAYGADPRQKLDIYIPDGLRAPAPVILFIYGGSWQMGSKDIYKFFGQAFASRGIVTVVADYRLYPQVKYPAFVQDTALAFKFVHDNIAAYGGDPAKLFLAGHSAGAYNVVMLDSDLHYLKEVGADPAWIRGVIGIAGPYDFLPLKDPKLIDIFGGDRVAATQPINYIDGKRAPMLLAYGTADQTVRPTNSINMAAKLRSFGSEVEVKEYPGISHIGIILSLAPGFRGNTSLRDDITQFVMTH
ncbi:MAG TPA: alpha/beta hydrolase [Bradyrhizobium sp.]|nr:alpha/beta hydrolase [Bradyrhizobium sp.]